MDKIWTRLVVLFLFSSPTLLMKPRWIDGPHWNYAFRLTFVFGHLFTSCFVLPLLSYVNLWMKKEKVCVYSVDPSSPIWFKNLSSYYNISYCHTALVLTLHGSLSFRWIQIWVGFCLCSFRFCMLISLYWWNIAYWSAAWVKISLNYLFLFSWSFCLKLTNCLIIYFET